MEIFKIAKKFISHFLKKERILAGAAAIGAAASVTKDRAPQVIRSGVNSAISTGSTFLNFFFKFLIIIISIFLFLFYVGDIFVLYNFILTYLGNFENIIGIFGVTWITNLIFIFILILLITEIFKKNNSNTIQLELKYFLVFLFIIIGISMFLNSDFMNLYSSSEQKNIVVEKGQSRLSTTIEKIKCSFNPACIKKDLNKNEAKTAKASSYSLSFNKKSLTNYEYSKVDLERDLILDYKIKSSGDLYLTKVECYLDKKEEENLFYTEDKSNQLIRTGNKAVYQDGIKCSDLSSAISKIQKEKKEEHTIISVLYFTFETIYSQKIPIINYNKFLEEEGLNSNSQYSYNYLKERLDKKAKAEKSFTRSNNALNMDDNILKDKLPLLFGDSNARQFSFPLSISVDDGNNFGKFVSGEILEINLPSSLEFDGETDYKKEINIRNKIFSQRISLKENDESFSNENLQVLIVQNMNIKVKSNFEKEDRFKIIINDEDFVLAEENTDLNFNNSLN